MTCPSCEQPVEDAALFCGNCGFRVRQENAAPAAEEVVPATTVSTPEPTSPVAPTAPDTPQPATSAPASQSDIPGYAVPQTKPAESHTLELVLSLLSIPASLFPLLGFALSIPALVLARKHKAVAPTVLSIIGVVLSVVMVIFNIVYFVQNPEELKGESSSTVLIAPLRTLTL